MHPSVIPVFTVKMYFQISVTSKVVPPPPLRFQQNLLEDLPIARLPGDQNQNIPSNIELHNRQPLLEKFLLTSVWVTNMMSSENQLLLPSFIPLISTARNPVWNPLTIIFSFATLLTIGLSFDIFPAYLIQCSLCFFFEVETNKKMLLRIDGDNSGRMGLEEWITPPFWDRR